VHEIRQHYVQTQKGVRSKENFSFRNTQYWDLMEPYFKKEVMMKKKLDTETRAVKDSATSKKFDASTIKEE
jgi:hypothetical protein